MLATVVPMPMAKSHLLKPFARLAGSNQVAAHVTSENTAAPPKISFGRSRRSGDVPESFTRTLLHYRRRSVAALRNAVPPRPRRLTVVHPVHWKDRHRAAVTRAPRAAGLPRPAFLADLLAAAHSVAAPLPRRRAAVVTILDGPVMEIAVVTRTRTGFSLVGEPGSVVQAQARCRPEPPSWPAGRNPGRPSIHHHSMAATAMVTAAYPVFAARRAPGHRVPGRDRGASGVNRQRVLSRTRQ